MSDKKEASAAPASAPQKSGKRKLGRGLGALLGEVTREEPLIGGGNTPMGGGNAMREPAGADGAALGTGLAMLAVGSIEPHPNQPRRRFDDEALEELAASISARGVIQPVIVRPLAGGRYQLVAGERRWRAAQKARLHEIPALVRELAERDVMALALIENLQREDLNPIEEARAYQRLSEDEGLSQSQIAQMIDKSRSHVANLQRLLALPDGVIDHVEAGRLSMGHARALIGFEEAESLAREAIARNLSVREVEKRVRRGLQPKGRATPGPPAARDMAKDADIAAVQKQLEEFLGLPVRIHADADPRSGTVTIRYRSLDQLDLVCERLSGGGI